MRAASCGHRPRPRVPEACSPARVAALDAAGVRRYLAATRADRRATARIQVMEVRRAAAGALAGGPASTRSLMRRGQRAEWADAFVGRAQHQDLEVIHDSAVGHRRLRRARRARRRQGLGAAATAPPSSMPRTSSRPRFEQVARTAADAAGILDSIERRTRQGARRWPAVRVQQERMPPRFAGLLLEACGGRAGRARRSEDRSPAVEFGLARLDVQHEGGCVERRPAAPRPMPEQASAQCSRTPRELALLARFCASATS